MSRVRRSISTGPYLGCAHGHYEARHGLGWRRALVVVVAVVLGLLGAAWCVGGRL